MPVIVSHRKAKEEQKHRLDEASDMFVVLVEAADLGYIGLVQLYTVDGNPVWRLSLKKPPDAEEQLALVGDYAVIDSHAVTCYSEAAFIDNFNIDTP